MSRSVLWVVVALVVVAGALWLSRRDTSQPLTHIEQIVPDNALAH